MTHIRAKVYQLNQDKWEDKGTGYADIDFFGETICIVVTSEVDGTNLLTTKLWEEETYKQERDTLIVWNDPESKEDLALSFSDKKNCKEFWEKMKKIQDKLKEADERDQAITIPPVTLSGIVQLHQILKQQNYDPTSIANAILTDIDYLDNLFELAEKLPENDYKHKHLFFEIFKLIILLNESNLLEILFTENYILRLMGVLEHDPSIPKAKRVNHREFLEKSVWKEVVPIKNKNIVKKIHQTHRIKYLKDTVLLGALDDSTFNTINTLIFYNHFEILTALQSDKAFLSTLFNIFLTEKNEEKLLDSVNFLQQFCELSKNLNDEGRFAFFSSLYENGILHIFTTLFSTKNISIQQNAIDILSNLLIHKADDVRDFVISFYLPDLIKNIPQIKQTKQPAHEKPDSVASEAEKASQSESEPAADPKTQGEASADAGKVKNGENEAATAGNGATETKDGATDAGLLMTLLNKFLTSENHGLIGQYSEILRRIIDNETMDTLWPNRDLFYSLLFKHFFPFVLPPLSDSGKDYHSCTLKCQIIDFLSFCASRLGSRIRSFFISQNVLEKCLSNVKGPGYLALAAIRIFRQSIGEKDRKMEGHIMHKNLFDPLIEIFRENKDRYNMINSSIIELFDFIDKEYNQFPPAPPSSSSSLSSSKNHLPAPTSPVNSSNFKFISYLVNRYREDFAAITYVPTFSNLLAKFDSHSHLIPLSTTGKRGRADFEGEQEEEDYFNGSDVDSPPSTPPVTDIDDEPSAPPPKLSKIAEEDEDKIIFPKRKKPKLQIKSISFHKNVEQSNSPPNSPPSPVKSPSSPSPPPSAPPTASSPPENESISSPSAKPLKSPPSSA